MSDPWNRFSRPPSSGDFVTYAEPSDMSPTWSGGILGNLGQFIDVRPSAQFPLDAPWNSPSAPLRQTSAQWPARPSVDPEALKFAAAWRRMYLTPRPPIFGAASDPPQTYSERYGQSSSSAENPEFLSGVAHDGDWTRAAELNGRHELSPRSLPDADMGNGTSGVSRLAGWPSANAPAYSMPSAAAVPASYQAGTRPWWAPVSPPGIFDPWREHALKGLLGLYKFFHDAGSYPSGGNRNGPGCKEEWEAAREKCEEWLSMPNPPRRLTGGYGNTEDCARGHVSERCGGKPIDW
jgi:hypothetical protein